MNVLKFGGTSVANASNIKKVQEIVAHATADKIAVVVSAFGGVTDMLLQAADKASSQDDKYRHVLKKIEERHLTTVKELIPLKAQSTVLSKVKSELNILDTLLEGAFLIGEITPKLSDKIVSFGELLSSFIISEYLISTQLNAAYKDSREIIITNNDHGKAVVDFNTTNTRCKKYFKNTKHSITVLPGFIAASFDGNSTTLGRGGSDYTAAIIASACSASELQIWTDVSGMYTANPKMVKQAKLISNISYQEAMELSHFGAKVMYPPTIKTVLSKVIAILIKNTF